MDWLAEILKHLAVSKTLVLAIFITAAVMYCGPLITSLNVPQLRQDFVPYLFAVMLLSGTLLFLWGTVAVWSFTHRGVQNAANRYSRSTLSDAEKAILFFLSQDPVQPLNLEQIDYSRTPETKLEIHQIATGLEKKGLIKVNPYSDNLISLTQLGRERALVIQKGKPGNVA